MQSKMREKTRELRRQHILAAAIKVFAERGFHRATIRHVAEEAGVSDGTIYNSFENKEALLLAVFDPTGDAKPKTDPAASVPPTDPSETAGLFLKRLISQRWALLTPAQLDLVRVILSEVLIDERLRAMYLDKVIGPALNLPVGYFEVLLAAGKIRAVDLALLSRVITGAFMGLVLLRLLGDPVMMTRWDDVPGELSHVLLSGLLPAGTEPPSDVPH